MAGLHLHLGETRRSAAGAALIFLDERESVGLLEELSAVCAEPSAVRLASIGSGVMVRACHRR